MTLRITNIIIYSMQASESFCVNRLKEYVVTLIEEEKN